MKQKTILVISHRIFPFSSTQVPSAGGKVVLPPPIRLSKFASLLYPTLVFLQNVVVFVLVWNVENKPLCRTFLLCSQLYPNVYVHKMCPPCRVTHRLGLYVPKVKNKITKMLTFNTISFCSIS